jgi:hypothetical protein
MNKSHRFLDSEQRFQWVEGNPQSQFVYAGFRRSDVERFATQQSPSNAPLSPAISAAAAGRGREERWSKLISPAPPIVTIR